MGYSTSSSTNAALPNKTVISRASIRALGTIGHPITAPVTTLFPPDCGTACPVRTAPVSYHTIIIEAPALAAVIPNSGVFGIIAQIGCVVHNKERS
jgi:hypothetical protein